MFTIDHSGCAGNLLGSLPNARVIVHHRGAPHLIDPSELWLSSQKVLWKIVGIFGEPKPVDKERIITASDGMEFEIGKGVKLKVIETLDHAAHHLIFHVSPSGCLFPGNAAGIYFRTFDAVVPTSPPPFCPDAALNSLQKLLDFELEALFYTHFGKADRAVDRLRRHVK